MYNDLLELHQVLKEVGANIDETSDTITNAICHVRSADKMIKDYIDLVNKLVSVNKQTTEMYHQVVQLLSRMLIELAPKKNSYRISNLLDNLIEDLSKIK